MKTIIIDNGFISIAESKAVCPFCERNIPFDEIERKYQIQNKIYIRMKCKCKRFIGIAMNIEGDYVAFDLKSPEQQCYIYC